MDRYGEGSVGPADEAKNDIKEREMTVVAGTEGRLS